MRKILTFLFAFCAGMVYAQTDTKSGKVTTNAKSAEEDALLGTLPLPIVEEATISFTGQAVRLVRNANLPINPGLPDNVRDVECYASPIPNSFEMELIMNCGSSSDHPVHSMSTPLVADIDGDGVTEILGCKCRTEWNPFFSDGFHVFDGQSGEYEYTIQTPTFSLCGQPVVFS